MPTKHTYINLDDPRNQFSFVCPIFEVTTKISQCFKLREKFWRGEKLEVRKGCQVCMRAGKCPAAAIVDKVRTNGRSWQDDYASDEQVVGKLRKDVLQRIHRPMVVESYYREFPGVSDAEKLKIETSSERIGKMIGAAPLPSDDDDRPSRNFTESPTPRKTRKAAPKPDNTNTKTNTVGDAAASGNLAAAINAA